jgi:predicted transcriptional regulator
MAKRTTSAESMKSTSFKIPESLHKQLRVMAAESDREMGEIVADALRAYFAKDGHRGAK